jgi:hypothetical protein
MSSRSPAARSDTDAHIAARTSPSGLMGTGWAIIVADPRGITVLIPGERSVDGRKNVL